MQLQFFFETLIKKGNLNWKHFLNQKKFGFKL